ncbi:hypothetical protein ABRT01_16880 [Lentibacillus sp. L22]
MIVLDRNLLAVPVEEIKEVKVELTVMDGEIVFQDSYSKV